MLADAPKGIFRRAVCPGVMDYRDENKMSKLGLKGEFRMAKQHKIAILGLEHWYWAYPIAGAVSAMKDAELTYVIGEDEEQTYDKSSRAENPMMDALKAIVLGACFGAVFCMIGLIACALVFMGAKSIPYQMIQQIVLVICGLGALLSGYLCVRISRKNGLLFGFLAALLLFLLMLLVSVAAIQEPLTQQSLLRGLLMVIAGAIGGVIGVNKKSKRR